MSLLSNFSCSSHVRLLMQRKGSERRPTSEEARASSPSLLLCVKSHERVNSLAVFFDFVSRQTSPAASAAAQQHPMLPLLVCPCVILPVVSCPTCQLHTTPTPWGVARPSGQVLGGHELVDKD